jgi:hypothetical protein
MFEPVFTVWSYCDGVREGIASVAGQPHVFVSEWEDEHDDYGEAFLLKPLTEQVLELAMAVSIPSQPGVGIVRATAVEALLADLIVDPARARQSYPLHTWLREWPEPADTSAVVRLAAEFVWGAEVLRWRGRALPAVQVRWSPC